MKIKYDYCCKKLRKYVEDSHDYDFSFSIKKGKFHWGEIEFGNYEDENTYYMEFCPFCGEKIESI